MKFSFLVPCYNTEKYINECIESIRNQTYQDWEIILMNDGSTDHTEEVLCDLAKKDSRIRTFNQKNVGVSATRNKAVDAATGDYLIFVDSDDRYKSDDCLEEIAKILNRGMADILVYRYETMGNNKILPIDALTFFTSMAGHTYTGEEYLLQVLKKDEYVYPWYPWLYVFKKEFWVNGKIRFDEKLWILEDVDIIYRVILKAQKVEILDKVVYQYRQREGSAVHIISIKSIQDRLSVSKKNIEAVSCMDINNELKKLLNSNFAYIYFVILTKVNYLKKHDRREAFGILRDYSCLMNYTVRHKSILIRRLICILGLRITSRLLFMRSLYMEN